MSKPWSDWEDAYLRDKWQSSTAQKIADALGRTRSAVGSRAYNQLKLPHKGPRGRRAFSSAKDPRVSARCQEFLRQFVLCKYKYKVCASVGLAPIMLYNLMDRDENFRQEVEKIAQKHAASKQCSTCGTVGPVSEFNKNNCTCIICEKAKHSRWRVTLRGKLSRLVRSARERDAACDLDMQYMVDCWEQQRGLCFYTGVLMLHASDTKRDFNLVSIDRLVPSKGYRRGNVVLCRWVVNQMKYNLTPSQFVATCQRIIEVYDVSVS